MFKLICGGCKKETTVSRIGESKDGFFYETFNGGFYTCPNESESECSCYVNVKVVDRFGGEIDGEQGFNRYILEEKAKFHVRCQVSGGVTGFRTSLLKDKDGAVKGFETREDAQREAERLNREMNHRNSVAFFKYSVED